METQVIGTSRQLISLEDLRHLLWTKDAVHNLRNVNFDQKDAFLIFIEFNVIEIFQIFYLFSRKALRYSFLYQLFLN